MNKEKLLNKLTLITFVLELILIVVLFIYAVHSYHNILGEGALNELSRKSSIDDCITGWLVFPAMIVDFFGVMGYIALAVAAICYLLPIAAILGWNVWVKKQNKNNKLWIKIAGIVPSGLLVIKVVKDIMMTTWGNSSILTMFYSIPAVIIFFESIVYINIKSKLRR